VRQASIWYWFFKPSLFVSFLKLYLFILCIGVPCSCLQTHQKRASDLITDGCEPPCGCWDLNSGPLEEQSVLLTTEPTLQASTSLLKQTVVLGSLYSIPLVRVPLSMPVLYWMLTEAFYYGVEEGTSTMEHVWGSEDNYVESVLPFHLYEGPRYWTQVSRLSWQVTLATEPSHWPQLWKFWNNELQFFFQFCFTYSKLLWLFVVFYFHINFRTLLFLQRMSLGPRYRLHWSMNCFGAYGNFNSIKSNPCTHDTSPFT